MSNKCISIVPANDEESSSTLVRIAGINGFPYLQYKESPEDTVWKDLIFSDHLARISDLYYIIRTKHQREDLWINPIGGRDLCIIKNLDILPDLERLPKQNYHGNSLNLCGNEEELTLIDLENYCERIMSTKNEITINETTNVDLSIATYYNLVSLSSLLNDKYIVDLISFYGYKYTNVLNLAPYITKKESSEFSAKNKLTGIKCGISYSKSEKQYSTDIMIDPGSKREDKKIYSTSDIRVEYTDNYIRVFADSNDITECIISYCFLIYE